MALAIRCAKIAIHHDESRTLIATGSLPLISRIKIQIETKLWKRFKCKGEENSILFLVTGVVQHQPGHSQIVAPGFQAVPNSIAPDGPTGDRINGGKLRKIEYRQLG